MKKSTLCCMLAVNLCIGIADANAQTQTLSPHLLSINGWMPDTLGGGSTPSSTLTCSGLNAYSGSTPAPIPCVCNGKIKAHWASVQQSGASMVRMGGITVDQDHPEVRQYLRFIDSVRARGMEPVLQIPLNLGETGIHQTASYDTTNIKNLVTAINVTNSRKVKYWIIGNEPDQSTPTGYGYAGSGSTSIYAKTIATYIKNYSKAMRRASGSFAIKIIGPELSGYTCDPGWWTKSCMDSLMGVPTYSTTCDIMGTDPNTGKYWIDYLSIHSYSYAGNSTDPYVTRQRAIDTLRKGTGFDSSLSYLSAKISAANSHYSRSANPIKLAVTEANTCYQTDSTDAWTDDKANGFYSGQHWMEMASICAENSVDVLMFWSAVEGALGYMNSAGTKKSTYHHFKMLTDNFANCDTYATATDNNSSGQNIKNIKAFGAKNLAKYVIVIMNQDTVTAAATTFSLKLGTTLPTSNTARIKANFTTTVTATYTNTIDPSSTMVLVFDCGGNIASLTTYKQSNGSSSTPSTTTFTATTILTANLDADRLSCCSTPLTCTPSISGANYDFRWALNNYSVTIQSGSSNSYANAPPQTYSVIVTKGGCTATDSTTLYGSSPTCCRMMGIDQNSFNTVSQLLNPVPNPSEGKVSLYYSLAGEVTYAEIVIRDISGKTVQKIPVKPDQDKAETDMSQYNNGIYFITLFSNGQPINTRRLVIAK
jgi:hypothetical protein